MKIYIILLIAGFSLSANKAFSAPDNLVEITVKNQIEAMLERSLGKEKYLIHVSGVYRNESDKTLLDSEVIQQKGASQKLSPLPDLPGFDVNPGATTEMTPAEYRREHYEHSEKEKLTKLNVHIFYDDQLDSSMIEKIKEGVLAYLSSQVVVKYAISFTPFLAKNRDETTKETPFDRYLLIAILSTLLLMLLIWAVTRLAKKTPRENLAVQPQLGSSFVPESASKQSKTVDEHMRSFLLEQIVGNPEIFRVYFTSLNADKKTALSHLLDGAAFAGMLKSLGLKPIESSPTTSEKQAGFDEQFFARDFAEFIKAFLWQRSTFFGFLPLSSLEMLIAFFREANPLHAAVVARFLPAAQTSQILSAISAEKRQDIIKNSKTATDLSLDEIYTIEAQVRQRLQAIPSAGSQLTKSNFDFLSDLVVNSQEQDKILADIKISSPDDYHQLSKLKFDVEDIPRLPPEVVSKVLGELDNKQLALVLVKMRKELADYLLQVLPDNRRALIVSQRATLSDASEQEVKKAERVMALLFRKEIT